MDSSPPRAPPRFHAAPAAAPAPARKRMRPQSAKAKGRRFQQWCAERFKQRLPELTGNDVRSLSMGAAGDDLILSPAAQRLLPYGFEMKNVETLSLWATLRQVQKRRDDDLTPCVVARKNRTHPVAIVPFGHLLALLGGGGGPAVRTAGPHRPLAGAVAEMLAATGSEHPLAAPAPWLCVAKTRLNFWKTWHAHAGTSRAPPAAMAVSEGSSGDAAIFAVIPFATFEDLVVDRAAAVTGPRSAKFSGSAL